MRPTAGRGTRMSSRPLRSISSNACTDRSSRPNASTSGSYSMLTEISGRLSNMPSVSAASKVLAAGNTWKPPNSEPCARFVTGSAYPGNPKQRPCSAKRKASSKSDSSPSTPKSLIIASKARLTARSSPRQRPSWKSSIVSALSAAHSNHSIITRRSACRSSLLGRRRARGRLPSAWRSVASVVRSPLKYKSVQIPSAVPASGFTASMHSGASTQPYGLSKSNIAASHLKSQVPTVSFRQSA